MCLRAGLPARVPCNPAPTNRVSIHRNPQGFGQQGCACGRGMPRPYRLGTACGHCGTGAAGCVSGFWAGFRGVSPEKIHGFPLFLRRVSCYNHNSSRPKGGVSGGFWSAARSFPLRSAKACLPNRAANVAQSIPPRSAKACLPNRLPFAERGPPCSGAGTNAARQTRPGAPSACQKLPFQTFQRLFRVGAKRRTVPPRGTPPRKKHRCKAAFCTGGRTARRGPAKAAPPTSRGRFRRALRFGPCIGGGGLPQKKGFFNRPIPCLPLLRPVRFGR